MLFVHNFLCKHLNVDFLFFYCHFPFFKGLTSGLTVKVVFLTVLLALLMKYYSLVSIRNILYWIMYVLFTSEMAFLWLSILKIFISLVILPDAHLLSTILLVFHCNHRSCPFSDCDCFRPSLMKVTPLHKNVLLGNRDVL